MPQVKFHLVGPHAGKTITFGAKKEDMGKQYPFENGVYTFVGSEKDALNIGKYLERCYQAYPEGPMLDAARAKLEAPNEAEAEAEAEAEKAKAEKAKAEKAKAAEAEKAKAAEAEKAKAAAAKKAAGNTDPLA